ncbi:MAG TPA: sulfite exporter TauE/SafE family protein [Flavobacteriales bacterium]
MELLGYIGAVLMGLSLGVIGGGGSILTIPILVYLFGMEMVTATGHSLFIVGAVSAVGGLRSWRKGEADVQALWYFGLPSVISVLAARAWLLPAIPELFEVGGTTITRSLVLLVVFALLMVVVAVNMIRQRKPPVAGMRTERRGLLIPLGLLLGLVTGLLGAGGGFLIIPALVFFAHVPMHRAIGTSLIIIAVNTLIGFAGDLVHGDPIDLPFLLTFTSLAILGVLVGGNWRDRIPDHRLKPAFGWFVLVMGIYIILKETAAMV